MYKSASLGAHSLGALDIFVRIKNVLHKGKNVRYIPH